MPPLEEIDRDTYQVAGIMSLRQLSKRLGLEIPETQSVTVGGVIQETMQRLAEPDDQCQWGPFVFQVIEAPQRGSMLVQVRISEQPEGNES